MPNDDLTRVPLKVNIDDPIIEENPFKDSDNLWLTAAASNIGIPNILAENYEQWEANQPMGERLRVINRQDLGGGRTEVS